MQLVVQFNYTSSRWIAKKYRGRLFQNQIPKTAAREEMVSELKRKKEDPKRNPSGKKRSFLHSPFENERIIKFSIEK